MFVFLSSVCSPHPLNKAEPYSKIFISKSVAKKEEVVKLEEVLWSPLRFQDSVTVKIHDLPQDNPSHWTVQFRRLAHEKEKWRKNEWNENTNAKMEWQ